MKKIIITITICIQVMVSSAFAGDIIGKHNLSNNIGLVRVKFVEGNKMAFDAIYAPANGNIQCVSLLRPE